MPYGTPARFLKGITTAQKTSVLGNFMVPNPLDPHAYVNDFDDYLAGEWTKAQVGTGTATLPAAVGGKLILTTTAGGADTENIIKLPAAFALVQGNQFWFTCNVSVSNIDATLVMGVQPANVAPMVPVDGMWFSKLGASANIDFNIMSASVTTAIAAVTTMAAGTATSLGFYFDGKASPSLFIYSSTGMTTPAAFSTPYFLGGQLVAVMGAESALYTSLANVPLPAILLAPTFGILNTTANARTLTVDYVLVASEQLRF